MSLSRPPARPLRFLLSRSFISQSNRSLLRTPTSSCQIETSPLHTRTPHSRLLRPPHSAPSLNQSSPPLRTTRTFTTTPSPLNSPAPAPSEPTAVSIERYHDLSDSYLDRLVSALEEEAETNEAWEVEYSAGVLSVSIADQGTWIINKQPPNKQIWLSSPVSGPKRFDYVEEEDGGPGGDYEDGGGRWVYLRDGTRLSELLRGEVGVVVPLGES